MSIRTKFLALLLATALLPMLVVVALDRGVSRDLGRELADRAGRALEARLTQQLRQGVAAGAAILHHQKETVELALRAEGRAIERLLALPGGDLAGELAAELKDLYENQSGLFLRLAVALADGTGVVYPEAAPGPRKPWYDLAVNEGGLVWTPPAPGDGEQVASAALSIRGGDGAIVGVVAIDVAVGKLLSDPALRSALTSEARFLAVDVAPGTEDGAPQLRMLARLGEDGGRDLPQLAGGRDLIDDIRSRKEGVRVRPFDGEPALWAHAPIETLDASLLAILPLREIEAETLMAERVVSDMTLLQLSLTGAFAVFMVVVIVVVAVLGAKAVTQPVRELDRAARRLAEGDLEARADVEDGSELGRLAATFNAMAPRLEDQVRLRQSLAVAAEIHANLLPAEAPKLDGFNLAGISLACDETGGDYFDFIPLSEGRLGVAVGDVTGHGISAALLMATARGLLRARADRAPSAADLFDGVNRQLARDALAGRFMTLAYLVLEPGRRDFRWANAGHEPPLVYDPGTDRFEALEGGGVPLGVDAEWTYEDFVSGPLADGALMVLATDGLWETRDANGEMFGRERLLAVLRAHAAESAASVLEAAVSALNDFRGDAPITDDVTLVVVRVA